MIALKNYQQRVLDSLREFFQICARGGRPEAAFQAVQVKNNFSEAPYIPIAAVGLHAGLPYICLRVPTGGGKTLLACHAAGIAKNDFMRAERAVILWLVPSNTILVQTAEALGDQRHPYRRALDLACGGVEVVTIDEALRLPRATVDGQSVVIVSTIQAFRVEDITGRKVYDQNSVFAEHLLNVPEGRRADLLKGSDGNPTPSLVNMLRLRRPVVIVDEAHNARTDLSFATLGNVLPSCVIEFTATPARKGNPSNVLHHVSAAELKAADMVKLPLRVVTRHPSQRDQLLAEAIALRADLERLALAESQLTGEYLRPILLIQAERVDACEPLRARLCADFGLEHEQIKISVGILDELPSADEISSTRSPVRFIITVQKLREGWDCPFAYVLCSLRETHSATAIEQIVGRVLRLPSAQAKQHPDLNCSYAFSVSESLPEVLNELRQALESNGFTAAEAQRIIIPVLQGSLPIGSQPRSVQVGPNELERGPMKGHAKALAGKVRIDETKGEITVLVPLDKDDTERLASCVKSDDSKTKVREIAALVAETEKAFGGNGQPRTPTPYELGIDFKVPLLAVREGRELFEFESTFLLEHPWKLSAKDASLTSKYNPLSRPVGEAGLIDVRADGKVVTGVEVDSSAHFVSTVHQHALQLGVNKDWTLESLVAWLDSHIDHRDIPLGESAEFLRKVIRGLSAKFSIADLAVLGLDRFRLRDEIEQCIDRHRLAERKAAFKQLLLPGSALAVSEEQQINFKTMGYEPGWNYEGGFQFRKHYFGPRPGELREKTPSGAVTEEFECAQYLDGLAEIRFWIRNLSRKASAFRLQTSSDWFYPDFVCELNDGRSLAVEYKGKDRYTAEDADEKRALGAVWESRSGGRCLFVMPTGGDFTSIRLKIGA